MHLQNFLLSDKDILKRPPNFLVQNFIVQKLLTYIWSMFLSMQIFYYANQNFQNLTKI